MHPGKESSALHPEDRDEDVGDKDEEDDDSNDVVHAVQTPLVGLFIDVLPGCNTHVHTHTKNNDKTITGCKIYKGILLYFFFISIVFSKVFFFLHIFAPINTLAN